MPEKKLSQSERQNWRARDIAPAGRDAAPQSRSEATRLAELETLNRLLEVAQAERRLLEQNLTAEQAEKSLQLQLEKEQAFAQGQNASAKISLSLRRFKPAWTRCGSPRSRRIKKQTSRDIKTRSKPHARRL